MMRNMSNNVTKEQAEALAREYQTLVGFWPMIETTLALQGRGTEEYLTEVGKLWQQIADSK